MTTGKLILTFLAGAAVGATAGVLLAPDKGDRTRRRITDSVRDLNGSIRKRADRVKEAYADAVESMG
jgi:gas vesicle protein